MVASVIAPPATVPSTPTIAPPRVAAIDAARAVAALMMVQGHTVDALLDVSYRETMAFHLWTVVRGLTPSMFIFLAGCALGFTAFRLGSSAAPVRWSKRLGRSLLLLVLGYAMHFPAENFAKLWIIAPQEWRGFFAVDVLQCIGVMLAALSALAVAARARGRFIALSLAFCAAIVVLSPYMWNQAWPGLPSPLAAYLTGAAGSLFPLFPWCAYGALGAAVGAALTIRRSAAAWVALAATGSLLLLTGVAARRVGWDGWAAGATAPISPSQFLLQAGWVSMILGTIALAIGRVSCAARSRLVESIGRESLLIYAVHICLVYGSPWGGGLRQWLGPTLSPAAAAGCVVLVLVSVGGLATAWHRLKQTQPTLAVRLRWATALMLGLILLA